MTEIAKYVYSGDCRLCDVGHETGFRDCNGNNLRTGDIVITYIVDQVGFSNLGGLTVVVSDQYQSYSDGTHKEKEGELEFFVMGIKCIDVNEDGSWRVMRVKEYEFAIDGEHWRDYGFSFQASAAE